MNDVMRHLHDGSVRRALAMMSEIRQTARAFLSDRDFEEIDTPLLMPRTGEHYNDTFEITLEDTPAMLADSPQMFKMLLAKAGFEKTFRFAHCFRAISRESNRRTRLSEFVQLDLELRDTSLEELCALAETLMGNLCRIFHRKVKVSCMSGLECRSKYGAQMCPDLRGAEDDVSLVFLKRMPLTNDGAVPCHHIFAQPSGDPFDSAALAGHTTESFDIIMNGIEIGGGDMRIGDAILQRKMMQRFHVDEGRYSNYLQILEGDDSRRCGGFAIGLERMVAVLTGAKDVRQTTAFPDYYQRGVN